MNEPNRLLNKNRINDGFNLENKEGNFRVEGCKSVDLDEIFQFSAARQRALERNAQVQFEQPFKNFVPNRVFINHVDSFNGRVLADYLSEQTIEVLKKEDLEEKEDIPRDVFNVAELSEDDGDFGTEKEATREKLKSRQNFEIIGTADFMKNPNYVRSESVREILDEEKKEDFLTKILTCGFIIYDISDTLNCHPVQIEEATWILNSIANQLEDVRKHAPKLFKRYKDCRTFVLISTLMTWAKTKPINPDDPSLPFTERDYRKRKPHPNYKVHCDFEKKVLEIGKKFPENLRTIVIGSGVTYGRGEDVLHFLFKIAWLNRGPLPLFKPGNNKIPLIHVRTLANIVHLIIDDFPASTKYIVAVEESPVTLSKIVKLISKKLGNGTFSKVSKEVAFTYPEIKQRNFDMLTVNVNIIPGYIINMELNNGPEGGFKENIDSVIAEFRSARNLKPIKIFIHGPPAIGKSYLSKRLAEYYKIHHLHVKEVVEEGIKSLKIKIDEIKSTDKNELRNHSEQDIDQDVFDNVEEDQDMDIEDEEPETPESLIQFLNDIEDSMASNEKSRLNEQLVLRLFKRRMLSNSCQNQGYVVDGYPKTLEETKLLYEPDDIEESEENDETIKDITKFYNNKIMPDFVASLDASDEFLIQKVIKMPQSLVQNTHYAEDEMCRRLMEFRTVNTEENTPLMFYDELDITPKIYNVENDNNDLELNFIFNDITQQIGPPRNYDPPQVIYNQLSGNEKKSEKYLEQVKLKSQKIIQERREKMENWMFLKNQEKEMEEKALALLAMPLRHYLMKYIFPTLTRGLVEVARVRPQDPVDYLAEFLFKENPEGKMFHPNYDVVEDEMMNVLREYELSLDGMDNDSDDNIQHSFSADDSVLPDAISNTADIKTRFSNLSLSSKRTDGTKKGTPGIVEDTSSGSCKCVQTSSLKSKTSSSSSSSSSTLPIPPSVCTCPPYPFAQSLDSKTSSSEESNNSFLQEPVSLCRCSH